MTILSSGFLLLSSYTYLFHTDTIEGIKELGFPDFFRVELAVLKVTAAVILIFPKITVQIKVWAYSGVMLFYITAMIAHIAHKDTIGILFLLTALIVILMTSYFTMKKVYYNGRTLP